MFLISANQLLIVTHLTFLFSDKSNRIKSSHQGST
jgi:hypothetical protein